MSGQAPPREFGKGLMYNGARISLEYIKSDMERLESISHSEARRAKVEGIRPCVVEESAFLNHLVDLNNMIRENLLYIQNKMRMENRK